MYHASVGDERLCRYDDSRLLLSPNDCLYKNYVQIKTYENDRLTPKIFKFKQFFSDDKVLYNPQCGQHQEPCFRSEDCTC